MDSETPLYERLLNQCKSNDVDVKVDALAKLVVEFEKGGLEVPDTEAVISVLKASLRTSNVHLTNAALSALPVILPALIAYTANLAQSPAVPLSSSSSTASVGTSAAIDVVTLRQALIAFLPAGGVIERLGDKEKAQVKARETLVILGGYAFRTGVGSTMSAKAGKGVEPPIAIFERFLKEVGLASKVWKVREQSILTLVHIRRVHHLFPIRPYLSLLVDCLEDTDPHVRECGRQSIVELFTGPGVSDGARADLKKELTKKNVRKTIVDGVLAKLLGGTAAASNPQSREGSENGDAAKAKEYVPPSMALQGKRPRVASQGTGLALARSVSQPALPRPASRAAMASPPPPTPVAENADVRPVYIASSRDLENEFAAMQKPYEGKETEFNWLAREQAVQRVRGMLKGDVHTRYTEPFLLALKEGFIQWSLKALASLRTTVSVNACQLYAELAVALGTLLDPFCETLLTNLLKMAGFTKKIAAQQSQATVTAILSNTSAQPRVVLTLLWNTLQEKTVQARAFVVAHLKLFIELHGQRSKNAIESSNSLETLEKSLKRALADPNPAVRESARLLFWDFEAIWRDRGLTILETLDAVARKQLEKACPNPDSQAAVALPPSTPKVTKKTSVAAAIAASRAKAKAIATAPPSLRHQATSASHAAPPLRRAGSPSTSPKSTTARPSSPQRVSTSPPSPSASRPRVTSSSLMRSTSAASVPVAHSRTPSGVSDRAGRAASPSLSDSGTRRRTSSPLAGSTNASNIRRALQTALPASPPSSVGQASPTPRAPGPATRNGAVPLPPRQHFSMIAGHDDESLLMAQTVPIPDGDTDSEDDRSVNLMSFSAPFEMYPPIKLGLNLKKQPLTLSPASDSKPTASVSNALSSGSISDMGASQQPVVEDALRARAEQAESAAERLLELVEPEDDEMPQQSILPLSLMKSQNSNGRPVPKVKAKPTPLPITRSVSTPMTPSNRANVIMRQAAMFVNSPAQNGRSSSLLDVLQSQKQETGWWLKRKALIAEASPANSDADPERWQELESHISALGAGEADVSVLKKLVVICMENTVTDISSPMSSPRHTKHPSSPTPLVPSHPSSLHSDMWEKNKTFERFFNAFNLYMDPNRTEEELAYGLVLTWEMLENQAPYLEGRESELMSMILRVRYCNQTNVLEGTNAIRDVLTSKLDPVYGLTTMHASLRVFHSDPPPVPDDEEVKASTYAFGLMALGKFILRLPAEIAEEELPRLKATLIAALNDRSSLIVRESAAASIIAAQLVLRDETHLFALLDGLADEKKNLLTYLFDKHGARGLTEANGHSGLDKLEKEIRRLDTRTSTPLRGGL
ncbi:clasp N terminal-domain-containing protein [Crassisporium funariophilum]|nr:clasp N terminal-domain-containing protein [Crassisporium funariophilum]